jgi:hypothetical protein
MASLDLLDVSLCPRRQQGEEGSESGSVGIGGVELDSGGKQISLMEALKAFSLALILFSLAFSCLSCSVSFLICSISFLIVSDSRLKAFVLASMSRTGRQFSIDKNDRHRGNDEGDTPLLGELEGAAGDGDVVIGGKQRDQANGETAEGLGGAEAIEGKPRAG